MALKPLMYMRKKGPLGVIFGKYANLKAKLAKPVGFFADTGIKMTSGSIADDGLTATVNFSQTVTFTELTIPNGMVITNTTTAEVATITASTGTGTTQVIYTTTWVTAPAYFDTFKIEYDGLGDYVDSESVSMEAQVISLVNLNILYAPIADALFDIPNASVGATYNYTASQNFLSGGPVSTYSFVDALGNPYGSEVVTFQSQGVTFQGESVTF